jgi:hypothetical protein
MSPNLTSKHVLEWAILIVAFDGFQTFHNPHAQLMSIAAVSGAGPEICIVGKNCVITLTTVKSTLKQVKIYAIVFHLCFVIPNQRSFRDCMVVASSSPSLSADSVSVSTEDGHKIAGTVHFTLCGATDS